MAKQRAPRRKANVDYSIDTPYLIKKKLTPVQQRAEYTVLRDIVQKRIKRIENYTPKKGQENPRDSEFYKRWKGGVPRIRDIKGKRLPYLLAALKRDVSDPGTTIKGYHAYIQGRVKALQDAGYTFINAGNIAAFGEFMEQWRAQKLDHIYGSPEVAEFYAVMEKKGISNEEFFKHFRAFMTNKAAISRMRKPVKAGKFSEFKAHLTKTKQWKKTEYKKKRK